MKKLLALICLASLAACGDATSAPNTDPRFGTSNPPPPPISGNIAGNFTAVDAEFSVARLSSTGGAQTAATGQTFTHQFLEGANYFKNKTGKNSWLIQQGLGKLISNNGGGKTTGSGLFTETDEFGNIWTMDLTQYTGTSTNLIVDCGIAHPNCLLLSTSVVASVQVFDGLDVNGKPIYHTITSSQGFLSFLF
jgi:hypothetical protein